MGIFQAKEINSYHGGQIVNVAAFPAQFINGAVSVSSTYFKRLYSLLVLLVLFQYPIYKYVNVDTIYFF